MTSIVARTLRLGHGFTADERTHVVDLLGRLDERLRTFGSERVDLELAVKERDTAAQRTTLVAKLGGLRRLVATSDVQSLDGAIGDVRDDLVRMITDATTRTEPKNNRHLR